MQEVLTCYVYEAVSRGVNHTLPSSSTLLESRTLLWLLDGSQLYLAVCSSYTHTQPRLILHIATDSISTEPCQFDYAIFCLLEIKASVRGREGPLATPSLSHPTAPALMQDKIWAQ